MAPGRQRRATAHATARETARATARETAARPCAAAWASVAPLPPGYPPPAWPGDVKSAPHSGALGRLQSGAAGVMRPWVCSGAQRAAVRKQGRLEPWVARSCAPPRCPPPLWTPPRAPTRRAPDEAKARTKRWARARARVRVGLLRLWLGLGLGLGLRFAIDLGLRLKLGFRLGQRLGLRIGRSPPWRLPGPRTFPKCYPRRASPSI
jgi:hypothetical protein